MTTPDQPDESTPRPAADETPESASTGSHSAPRPVPPIDDGSTPPPPSGPAEPAFGGATTPEGAGSGAHPTSDGGRGLGATDATAAGTAPARVSAFGGAARPSADGASADTHSGAGATTKLPVAEAEPTGATVGATTPIATTGSTTAATTTDTETRPVETSTTQVVPPGRTVPLADEAALAGSTGGRLREQAAEKEPYPEEEWHEPPVKRTAAHLWSVLGILVAAPIAWFLLTDGALRTFWSLQAIDDKVNVAGLLSLAGGLVTLLVIALVTRASSLGTWIWGGVIALAGIGFLVFPREAMQWLRDHRDTFTGLNEGFGTNVYNYLLDTGRSGLLLTFGVVLLLLALVAHTTRRSGRNEGRIKAERAARGLD
ncbi:hypothetical protein [Miniimonas sp. S16]|uniref:hypothetical protein n=1 Tax=Miniimonas sp. S16 TaxID=2171623 RepID=UPI000D52759A|nr:hypothetical protein [Miniimonas sp. S16]